MRYKTKHITVDAHQLTTEEMKNYDHWPEWLQQAYDKPEEDSGALFYSAKGKWLYLRERGILCQVVPGDYIVRESDGTLQVFRSAQFNETYEEGSS